MGHELTKAYNRVLSIKDNQFDLAEDLDKFLEHLEKYGTNRYLDLPFQTFGHELLALDLSVWNVRRYCQSIGELESSKKKYGDLRNVNFTGRPHIFRIRGGFLEQVLARRQSDEARKILVWKNPCYGSRNKGDMKNYILKIHWRTPYHYLNPDVYNAVKDMVQFPKPVKTRLEQRAASIEKRRRKNGV